MMAAGGPKCKFNTDQHYRIREKNREYNLMLKRPLYSRFPKRLHFLIGGGLGSP